MRERLAAAGIDDAGVSVSSGGGLTITAPAGARADVSALGAARPARDLRLGAQRARSARRAGAGRCERDRRPGRRARRGARAEARRAPAAGAGRPRQGDAPDGWFALGGDPALTNADIARAAAVGRPSRHGPDRRARAHRRAGRPRSRALTRELAHRGSAQAADGVERRRGAPALRDRARRPDRLHALHRLPQAPDGIDGAEAHTSPGDLTPETARRIAALLSAGPLPADLVLESEAGG